MPTFIYTNGIPDGPHNPSVDQGPMKVNTDSIDSIISQDHYSFEQSNNDGWHKQSTYVAQTAPVTVGSQLALYSKTGPQGTELYSIRDGVGATETLLIPARSSVVAPQRTTNGFTFLPGPATGASVGGILMQWGFYGTLVSGGPTALTFAGLGGTSFAVVAGFTPIVTLTPFAAVGGTGSIIINSTSATGFSVFNTSVSITGFYWHAIGPI